MYKGINKLESIAFLDVIRAIYSAEPSMNQSGSLTALLISPTPLNELCTPWKYSWNIILMSTSGSQDSHLSRVNSFGDDELNK